MASMRAKMIVQHVTRHANCEVLAMAPVARSGSYPVDGSDEDNTFAKFSPSGSLSLTVCNPALIGQFNPGDAFYVDFSPVPVAAKVAA